MLKQRKVQSKVRRHISLWHWKQNEQNINFDINKELSAL